MDARYILHVLLYEILLDIRVAAYTNEGTNMIFDMADLFHNIPLRLNQVPEGRESYDDVLAWLRQRAQEKRLSQWLERRIAGIKERDTSG